MKFFVFSLPRSGSAWLANFLSFGDLCYHDPSADMKVGEFDYLGAVDTAAYASDEWVNAMRSRKCFALVRDSRDIEDSARRLGFPYSVEPQLQRFEAVTQGMTKIYYSRLFDAEYAAGIWRACYGSECFMPRARQLVETNIQKDMRRFLAARDLTWL